MVRDLLVPALVGILVPVVLSGALGSLAIVDALRSSSYLTGELAPAQQANAAVLQHMTDAETGVRAWAQSGREASLEPYERARERLPRHQGRLRTFAEESGDAELQDLVSAQQSAASAWLAGYAEPRLAREGGPGTFSEGAFRTGERLFDDLRSVHTDVTRRMGAIEAERREDVRDRLRTTLAVTGALLLLAVVVAFVLGRRVRTAYRTMAAENERARAVEQQVLEQLGSLDRAEEDFLARVSHELRTPLTTVTGYLELLVDDLGPGLSPQHRRMVGAMERNVERLGLLIEDLLALSRAEDRPIEVEPVGVDRLLEQVASDIRLTASRRRVTVTVAAAAGVHVSGDRTQLRRALVNLASNAVKFSHDGGEVTLSAARVDDEVEIRAVDHGIGVPRDDLARVGTRFFRAGNAVAREIAGTGLGLRIVQTIIDNHAGSLRLESVEGEGTTVVVRLPAREED